PDDFHLTIGRDHRDADPGMERTKLFRQRHSVLARHIEIDERYVRGELPGLLQRLDGIGSFDSLPVRIQRVEYSSHGHSGELAVIDDQYCVRHEIPPRDAVPAGMRPPVPATL